MGIDIHVKILHRNKNGEYEYLTIYNKDGEDLGWAASYCDRNYLLFDVLRFGLPIHSRGMFPHFPEEAREEHMEDYCWGFNWVDWCELCAYADNPMYYAVDDDEENFDQDGYPLSKRVDVLGPWVGKLSFVLNAYCIFSPIPGDIIIQFWFDN